MSGARMPRGRLSVPKRPRWADLVDTSNEATMDSPRAPLLLAENSYCELPDREVEHGELGKRMQGSVALEAGPPKDFNFLMGVQRDARCDRDLGGGQAQKGSAATTGAQTWCTRGSADDPGPQQLQQHYAAVAAAAKTGGATDFSFLMPDPPAVEVAAGAAAPTGGPIIEGGSSQAPPPRRRVPRKRAPHTAPAKDEHPTDSKRARPTTPADAGPIVAVAQGSGSAEASAALGEAVLKPCAGEAAAMVAPTEPAEAATNGAAALPEATEEDWRRREAKRHSTVNAMRASPEYQCYKERRARNDIPPGAVPVPKTPDPEDRNVSKRRWEWEVRQWRDALRQWHSNGTQPGQEDGGQLEATADDEGMAPADV